MTYNPDRMTSLQILDGKLRAAGAADERIEMAAIDLSNIQRTITDYQTELQELRRHLGHSNDARLNPQPLDDQHWAFMVKVLEDDFQEVLTTPDDAVLPWKLDRFRLNLLRHFADAHHDASLLMAYRLEEPNYGDLKAIGYGIWRDVFDV